MLTKKINVNGKDVVRLTDEGKKYAVNAYDKTFQRSYFDYASAYFGESIKHDKSWAEYGYPSTVTDFGLYWMYRRMGVAHASVDRRVDKVWQEIPEICSGELDDKKTSRDDERDDFEESVDKLALKTGLWRVLKDIERKALYGRFGLGVMLLKDNKDLESRAHKQLGLNSLKKIIPVNSAQVNHIEFDTDPKSDRYLEPKYFNINSRNIDGVNGVSDNYTGIVGRVHYSRVIWCFYKTEDDIDAAQSLLEPGYNDLLDIVKVSGGGAEGHWKNSARQLNFKFDKDASIAEIAAGLGVSVDEVADALNDQVNDLNNNLDAAVVTIGGDIAPISSDTPDSKEKYEVSLSNFCASVSTPQKVLVGNQTGERASSEDNSDWAQTCQSHRNEETIPFIRNSLNAFISLGILPNPKDDTFGIAWQSLLDPSPNERIERGKKMTEINKNTMGTGVEAIYTREEIRTETGFNPDNEEDEEGEA